MSPVSSKICKLCHEGFRGTPIPEEVYCAKCYVKTCEVPEDTEEQFHKLVTEIHGSELNNVKSAPSALVIAMMDDIGHHKKRLNALEATLENNKTSTKEKNRLGREILRLRAEQAEMDKLLHGIKAKMAHVAMMSGYTDCVDSPAKAETPEARSPHVKVPQNTPVSPKSSPDKLSRPVLTHQLSPFTLPSIINTPATPIKSPPSLSEKNTVSTESPVKKAAMQFEAAAKKRRSNSVSFAKEPTSMKIKDPEMNNNTTVPVISSSEEDLNDSHNGVKEGNGTGLTRSNSVRDRIKAFEAIQRSFSTGSYDRKKTSPVSRGSRSVSTMKGINI